MTKPCRILVVDDAPADRRLIKIAFDQCSYDCALTFAATAAAAEQLLVAQAFDLLLSDFGTDLREATRFLRRVRESMGTMPIVVLSGFADARPAYQAGANAFVAKSPDLHEFFKKVEGLMHFWIRVAELPSCECPNSVSNQ
jgi:CheY-like chemotaxis protein